MRGRGGARCSSSGRIPEIGRCDGGAIYHNRVRRLCSVWGLPLSSRCYQVAYHILGCDNKTDSRRECALDTARVSGPQWAPQGTLDAASQPAFEHPPPPAAASGVVRTYVFFHSSQHLTRQLVVVQRSVLSRVEAGKFKSCPTRQRHINPRICQTVWCLTRLTCEAASEAVGGVTPHTPARRRSLPHAPPGPGDAVGPRRRAARPPSRRGAVEIPSHRIDCGLRLYVLRT